MNRILTFVNKVREFEVAVEKEAGDWDTKAGKLLGIAELGLCESGLKVRRAG